MTEQTDLASLFYGIPFQKHVCLELLPDHRVRAPDLSELKNHVGTMHGGMLFALGEVAAAVAMAELLARDRAYLHAITRRGDIAYLKPARGAITASSEISMTRAEILSSLDRQPSVDVPVAVALTDPGNVTVAELELTWYVARVRSQKCG